MDVKLKASSANTSERAAKMQARKKREGEKPKSPESISEPDKKQVPEKIRHDKMAMISDKRIESIPESVKLDEATREALEKGIHQSRSGVKSKCYFMQFTDPLNETTVFPYNLRPEKDLKNTEDLDSGILVSGGNSIPVIVRPKGEKYEVICGSRRRASTIKMKKPLNAIVVEGMNDNDAKFITATENQGRKALDPFSQVAEWNMMLDGDNPAISSVTELATVYSNKHRTYISKNRIIQVIPPDIYLNITDRSDVKMKHAYNVAKLYAKLPKNKVKEIEDIYKKNETSFSDFARIVKDFYESEVQKAPGSGGAVASNKSKRLGTTTVVRQYEGAYLTSNKSQKAVVFSLPDNVELDDIDIEDVHAKMKALFSEHTQK